MKFSSKRKYSINRTFEETFQRLNSIVSTHFNDSKYSTFGSIVSLEPPEFLLMAKWASIGRPEWAEFASTKIHVKLVSASTESKIVVGAKSNPGIIFLFGVSAFGAIFKLVFRSTEADLKIALIYVLVAVGLILFDRVVKNIVISSFETDMQLK